MNINKVIEARKKVVKEMIENSHCNACLSVNLQRWLQSTVKEELKEIIKEVYPSKAEEIIELF